MMLGSLFEVCLNDKVKRVADFTTAVPWMSLTGRQWSAWKLVNGCTAE